MIKIRGSVWPMAILGVFTLGLSLVFLFGGRANDVSSFGLPIWVLAAVVLIFSLWIWSCVIYTVVLKRKS
jgi:hypothetical protein